MRVLTTTINEFGSLDAWAQAIAGVFNDKQYKIVVGYKYKFPAPLGKDEFDIGEAGVFDFYDYHKRHNLLCGVQEVSLEIIKNTSGKEVAIGIHGWNGAFCQFYIEVSSLTDLDTYQAQIDGIKHLTSQLISTIASYRRQSTGVLKDKYYQKLAK